MATPKPKPKPAPAMSGVTDEDGKELTVQQLKNKLRNEAEREVLDKHKDEVHEITGKKYAAHGLEYVRRLTDAEKAQKQIEELLAAHPELRPQFAKQLASLDGTTTGRGSGADERGVPPYAGEPDKPHGRTWVDTAGPARGDYGMSSLGDQEK